MIKMMEYLKSLIKANTLDSSKSFSMVACVLSGIFLVLILGFCLVWDVCTNGYIKTDSNTILCTLIGIGGMIAGSSAAKIVSEHKNIINKKEEIKDGRRE